MVFQQIIPFVIFTLTNHILLFNNQDKHEKTYYKL